MNCYDYMVVTVYDMIHELFGLDERVVEKKRDLLAKADAIIAISENTKADIVNLMGIDEKKISIIYLANSLVEMGNLMEPLAFPYILYVGNREGYKNFDVLVKAFSKISLKRNLFLVCFEGGGSFQKKEKELLSSLGGNERVKQISGDDKTLASLYQHAEVFVYPSLYEGFGLPILEAMHYGTPVLTSSTSSMPEVAGGAAELFDPYSIDELTFKLNRILSDDGLKKTIRNWAKKEKGVFHGKSVSVKQEIYMKDYTRCQIEK